MDSIITYLVLYIQYLHKQIFELTLFISIHIPLKQWTFDDSNSLFQCPHCAHPGRTKIDRNPVNTGFRSIFINIF